MFYIKEISLFTFFLSMFTVLTLWMNQLCIVVKVRRCVYVYVHTMHLWKRALTIPGVSCKALLCMHLLLACYQCMPTRKPSVTIRPYTQPDKFIFVVSIVWWHLTLLLCCRWWCEVVRRHHWGGNDGTKYDGACRWAGCHPLW